MVRILDFFLGGREFHIHLWNATTPYKQALIASIPPFLCKHVGRGIVAMKKTEVAVGEDWNTGDMVGEQKEKKSIKNFLK